MIIPPDKFTTCSLSASPLGNDICQILSAAIHCADPGVSIKNKLSIENDKLIIDDQTFELVEFQRVIVLGAGKAVVPMAETVVELLGNRISSGLVITKDGYAGSNSVLPDHLIKVVQAGHPTPDQRNLDGSSLLVTKGKDLSKHDLVICLLSGGGSSLLVKPSSGLSLADIQEATSLLLSCGASISEINMVRKHTEDLKGGGLAKILFPATVITLILSDVIGDSLDVIASGPTVADPTTYIDAWSVLNKYQVLDQVSARFRAHLDAGIEAMIADSVKHGDPVLSGVHNFLIGNNTQTALATVQAAINLGFNTQFITEPIQGEASIVGQTIADRMKLFPVTRGSGVSPACFIAGGETTVTVRGKGKGGRNQELALGAVKPLSGSNQIILVSLATDGGDGPTDAAGAVVTNQTYSMGLAKGINPTDYLQRNDSYNYFDRLGDLIKIGPTLTNVNDLLFIFTR